MSASSSYLQYLPPVLWSRESDPQQLLGDMLRIFEKILTGIDDPVAIGSQEKPYPPLEELIDALPSFFNPWRTPAQDFLPWLATWLALDLPADPTVWTEYQRRKITARIVAVYRMRGLTQGLYTYLDIYAQTKARPRIAIDDGKAVLRLRFSEDGTLCMTPVVYSQVVAFPEAPGRPAGYFPVLIHPAAIAIDSHNDYLVVDQGVADDSDPVALSKGALWKISSTGHIAYTQGNALPVPHALQSGDFFQDATAAVIDDITDALSVINIGGEPSAVDSQRTILRRFTPPDYAPANVIDQTTTPRLPVVRPVDMVLDEDRRFVILDRGVHYFNNQPAASPAKPKLVVVSENPLAAEPHPLAAIVEPTALVRAPDGTFIVADAKKSDGVEPADLWRVDPSNGWKSASLLDTVPPEGNPLIFPTGMVFDTPTELLVCDTGLRLSFKDNPSNRAMAEPAAIFRVDLGRTPPVITRLTSEPCLVNPAKMAKDRRGKIIVIDAGEFLHAPQLKRNWRAHPNEIGVVVHFSQQRPTDPDERNRTRRGITGVLDEQKPSHISWWLKSE
jgi:phage tail-like protein